ncbi:hypothetical protein [Desulfosporosinus sp. OT]|nr:hypothetical protein [Desulfosporosinus sp. OT]EGW37474.1 hypothetical protein DOT_4661 [Desulfosporosinus sp. OT]
MSGGRVVGLNKRDDGGKVSIPELSDVREVGKNGNMLMGVEIEF